MTRSGQRHLERSGRRQRRGLRQGQRRNPARISAESGKKKWARSGIVTGVYGPTVAGGRVYYTTDLAIQALDAKSGAPVWSFTTADAEFLTTPAVAGGLVFVGCGDDSLYAVQA